jgi:hypothetical protein
VRPTGPSKPGQRIGEDRGFFVALDADGLGQAPAFPVSRDQPTGLGDIVSRRQSQDQPAEERPPERAAAEEPPEEAQQQQQPDTALHQDRQDGKRHEAEVGQTAQDQLHRASSR